MSRLKIALIGNTGLGNKVFKTLISENRVSVDSVCTRKLEGQFPYYDEIELADLVEKNNICCFVNVDVNKEYYHFLKNREVDLIIVASFHQILKKEIIELARIGAVNLHPSLLPKYRGPSPLNWIIINNELKTGITAHFLTEEIDAGNIVASTSFHIESNETLGTLYEKSACHAGELVIDVINVFEQNSEYKGEKQNENIATYVKRPSINERIISDNMKYSVASSILKAFHPFPGALIKLNNGSLIKVKNYSIVNKDGYKQFTFGSTMIYLLLQ